MLLNMSTHVLSAPETFNIQSNDPAETIQITVNAERAHIITWWYQKEGWSDEVQISGANSLTLSLPRSEYTDENGNWDPSKVDGTYYCYINNMRFGNTTKVEIDVKVVDHVSFTSDPKDKVAATGGIAEFNVGISKDPPFCGELWWEYSFDDGATWEKVTQGTSNESFIVQPSVYFIPIETDRGIVFHSHYDACKLTVNAAGLNAEKILVRCGMKDSVVTYYTKTATLTFVDMPVIGTQPQSQVVSVTQGTAYMEYAFEAPLPEEYTVTYQWQGYNDEYELYEHWEDVNSNDTYTCSDQRIEFNLSKHLFSRKYRCKISFTDAAGVTIDVYTAEATLEVVTMPVIRSITWSSSYITEGDHLAIYAARDPSAYQSTRYTGYKWQICKDGVNWVEPDDSFTMSTIGNDKFCIEFDTTKELESPFPLDQRVRRYHQHGHIGSADTERSFRRMRKRIRIKAGRRVCQKEGLRHPEADGRYHPDLHPGSGEHLSDRHYHRPERSYPAERRR